MTSCNSWQYLGKILAKIFQFLLQLLRYPWRVDPGKQLINQVTLWTPKSAFLSENLENPKIGKKEKRLPKYF